MKLLFSMLLLIFFGSSSGEDHAKRFIDHRDENSYEYVEINSLKWMMENLRYKVSGSMTVADSTENCEECGEFYFVHDAFDVCPENWRLPTEREVKALIKWHKKQKLSLTESLSIVLCGRVDNGRHSKPGSQNTYWVNADLVKGHIIHWHTFLDEQELHSHDVIHAERQFPVRCVCEIGD
ncbi:MAG: FISUMP domain-containing protein [Crocinitomicaceae bacterium]